MIDITGVVLGIILLALIFGITFRKKHRNLPPGPRGIFLIGHPVVFKKDVHISLTELGKKYGNIYSIYFGTRLVIVLNDYKAIREALVKQGEKFSGRPVTYIYDWLYNRGGIIMSFGHTWNEQRKFALHTLSEFGFGKASLEDRIMVEVENTIKIMASYNGKPFRLHNLLDKATANVICSLSFDERYSYEDPHLDELLLNMEILFREFRLTNPVNFFPFLRFISTSFKEMKRTVYNTREHLNKIFNAHMETYQEESPRDFIDVFIKKMKEDKENSITDTTFTKQNLLIDMENFLNAGTETTSTTLLWTILYMVNNPDKQKRMQEELDHVIGPSRFASLNDKPNLPYTEASIMEVHRMASLAPLSVFHKTENDTIVFDYFIPKGTLIIPNLWAAHYDPNYWINPKEFRPERFIDEEGQLKKNVESLIPFGIGKRVCLGESLARMEMSLFVANLFLKFNFMAPNPGSPPNLRDYDEGITLRPKPFTIIAKLR